MKLRSALLFFLVFSLTVVMTTPIEAQGTSQGGASSVTATTVAVTQPEFSIAIPAKIEVGAITRAEESSEQSKKETGFVVTVSGASYLNGRIIEIAISTPDGVFQLHSDGTYTLPYEVYNRTAERGPIANGGVFHTFSDNGSVSGAIVIDQYDIPAAGEYNGSLIFTVTAE